MDLYYKSAIFYFWRKVVFYSIFILIYLINFTNHYMYVIDVVIYVKMRYKH